MPSLPTLMSQNRALPSYRAALISVTMPARLGSGVDGTTSGARPTGSTWERETTLMLTAATLTRRAGHPVSPANSVRQTDPVLAITCATPLDRYLRSQR